MSLERNLDGIDRIVRGVLGVWLAVTAVSALREGRRTTAATLGIAGSGLLVNAWTSFCGCNAVLGLDTTDG